MFNFSFCADEFRRRQKFYVAASHGDRALVGPSDIKNVDRAARFQGVGAQHDHLFICQIPIELLLVFGELLPMLRLNPDCFSIHPHPFVARGRLIAEFLVPPAGDALEIELVALYHAVPTNFPALAAFRLHVVRLWRRTLRRRSQKDGSTWKRIEKLADDFLPKPRILHPWPSVRFAVKHPRWEPYAGNPHVPICAGASGTGRPYRDPKILFAACP